MKNKKQEIEIILKDSYLGAIKNSLGAKLWQNFYALVHGKKKDILRQGNLSCAYFVSSILKISGLIKDIHMTVSGTIADMKQSGWKTSRSLKQGSVLVWEKQKFGKEEHAHIGFFIGNNQAISNSSKKRTPMKHSFTFGGKRKIEGIFWHKKLGKSGEGK